jgi:hypothetical protein
MVAGIKLFKKLLEQRLFVVVGPVLLDAARNLLNELLSLKLVKITVLLRVDSLPQLIQVL